MTTNRIRVHGHIRYNNGLPVIAPSCPTCGGVERQIKIGFNPSGSRRYRCQLCGQRYTPKSRGHYEAEQG